MKTGTRNLRQRVRKAVILFSLLLFPVTLYYFSPALAIQSAAQGIIGGSLVMFLLLFVSAMVFGRAWCGWVCPGAGLTEACLTVNSKRFRGGRWNWLKWGIWFPWMSLIAVMALRAGGLTDFDPFYSTVRAVAQPGPAGEYGAATIVRGISVVDLQSYVIYAGILALIAVPSILAGRRAFCHSICWMAPFMILARKLRNAFGWPSLQLSADSQSCTGCKTCTTNCPMSLEVDQLVARGSMEDNECILCGTCVDNCPNGVLGLVFAGRSSRSVG